VGNYEFADRYKEVEKGSASNTDSAGFARGFPAATIQLEYDFLKGTCSNFRCFSE
jgi:hypothetical protein